MDNQENERLLISILDRQTECDALSALISALRPATAHLGLEDTAIGLDANAFLRLAGHQKSTDIIDYLSSRHTAPLVLPGQAIQEFWNNQLQVVDTVAAALRKQFEAFKTSLAKIDKNFMEYVSRMDAALEQFAEDHGHIYDADTIRKTLTLLDAISERAIVAHAPRVAYQAIADIRKRTKTPPGFRDEGDGDFFIWVDLLTGLQRSKSRGDKFSRVALVSLDRKVDWSRSGVAHPVLVAEVQTLLNVPFEIWTIDKLASEIAKST